MTPRARVESALGRPVSDAAWEEVGIRRGYERELEMETMETDEVADLFRVVGGMYQQAPRGAVAGDAVGPPQVPGAHTLHQRALAISAWVARAAAADSKVKFFRHLHLRRGLVNQGDVGAWVRQTYARNLPVDWPELGAPEPGWAHGLATHKAEASGRPFVLFDWAELSTDGEWQPGRWPVPPRSVLGRLVEVMERLERQWHWSGAEAALFILTGFQPYVAPIAGSCTVGFNYNEAMGGSYDVLSRVNIKIDPTITPEQLAGWWRPVRKEMLEGRRYRPLSEKHLRLAEFMASRDDKTSWDQDLTAWNRKHPEWRYDDRRNFHRDASLAIGRVLQVGIRAPRD